MMIHQGEMIHREVWYYTRIYINVIYIYIDTV